MSKQIIAYHFVSEPLNNSIKLFKKISSLNGIVCFDFEDSLMNINSNSFLKTLKNQRRAKVSKFFKSNKEKISEIKFGIRINETTTKDYNDDLTFIDTVNKSIKFHSIFLPKIKNSDTINYTEEQLAKYNVSYKELIPIIESKEGMDNIGEIISGAKNKFNKLAFGHCDYNLDNSLFPFHHQNSKIYWQWVNTICKALKKENKMLINSPFLFLDDDEMFNKILNRLINKDVSFGQITMCLRQTELCKNFNNNFMHDFDFKNGYDNIEDIKEYAREIISNFKKHKFTDKSFAVDYERVLISPHEYLAAIKYLGRN